MELSKLTGILVLVITGCCTVFVTSLPALGEKPKAKRGPRADLNETGRFLFPRPHFEEQKLLCKNCSVRALADSTYRFEQQLECIEKNLAKFQKFHISPYCNVGNDLGCGDPPKIDNNSHWICDTGYSNVIHTVYSTCQLVCNSTDKIIKEIYCMEILQWYTDVDNTETTPCGGKIEDIITSTEVPVTLIIVILVIGIILVIMTVLLLWYCVIPRLRKNSQGNSDEIKTVAQNRTPSVDRSIGACSIEEDNESHRLLTTELNNQDTQANDQLPASVDSGVGPDGQTRSNSDVSGSQSDKAAGGHAGSSNLSSSDKSVGTDDPPGREVDESPGLNSGNRDSQAQDQPSESCGVGPEDQPYVIVFVQNSRTFGNDSIRLQGNIHSAPRGSNVYFVASNCDVSITSIRKKEDGEELKERLSDENGGNIYALMHINDGDAGIYIFTLVQRVDDTDEEFTQSIELYVGAADSDVCAPEKVGQRDVPKTSNQNQNSANEQDNVVNPPTSISDVPHNQRLNMERLPPEGADNDQQMSGQGNVLFSGARPKTSGMKMTTTKILISGQSSKGNQDIPRKTIGRIDSNDLNKMRKESKNDLNQFDIPRNISADQNEQNLRSIENNIESLPVVVNSERELLSTEPVNSRETLSLENNNSPQSQDSAGDSKDECTTEPTSSVTPDKSHAGESEEKPSSFKMPPVVSLPFSSLLSSGKESIEKPKMPPGPPLGLESMLNSSKDISENYIVHDNGLNHSDHVVETQTDFDDESRSESVELPINILEELKPDLSELLSNSAGASLARNPPDVNNVDVPAVGQLIAVTHEQQAAQREDPSGEVCEPVVTEIRPAFEDQTAVKTIYQRNANVGGERSTDVSSPLEPARPRAGPAEGGVIRGERGAVGETSVGNTGVNSPQLARREEVPVEPGIEDRCGAASENVRRARIIDDRCREPHLCNTYLSSITDSVLLQRVSVRANPIEKNGEARSWLGLALFYGFERHYLDAVWCACSKDFETGPMHQMMTKQFVNCRFKIGHIVKYFTRNGSEYPEIVDMLIDDCEDHVDCRYCERLRQRSGGRRE